MLWSWLVRVQSSLLFAVGPSADAASAYGKVYCGCPGRNEGAAIWRRRRMVRIDAGAERVQGIH